VYDQLNTGYTDNLFHQSTEIRGRVDKDPLRNRTLRLLNEWVNKHESYCHKKELELLGRHLYALLFDAQPRDEEGKGPSVEEAFRGTCEYFQKQAEREPDSRLRLQLIFHPDAADISDHPWEFIFLPEEPGGKFLAGQITQLILTRLVPDVLHGHKRDTLPLRILIADCKPRDLPAIDSRRVVGEIEKLRSPGVIEVETLDNPTFQELEKAIKSPLHGVHILHFISHGRADQIAMRKPDKTFAREKAELERQANETGVNYILPEQHVYITSTALGNLLTEQPPRLVFLHACEGAAPGSLEEFRSTAHALVSSKVQVVVAMQYPISNENAAIFARTFYQQLAMGKELDEAVAAGRRKLGTRLTGSSSSDDWDDRSFGTPVVYLRTRTPIVLPTSQPSEAAELEEKAAETQPVKWECPGSDCPGARVWPNQRRCAKCFAWLEQCADSGNPPTHLRELGKPCVFCGPPGTRSIESSIRAPIATPGSVAGLPTGGSNVA
jgi:hypothetical protein